MSETPIFILHKSLHSKGVGRPVRRPDPPYGGISHCSENFDRLQTFEGECSYSRFKKFFEMKSLQELYTPRHVRLTCV